MKVEKKGAKDFIARGIAKEIIKNPYKKIEEQKIKEGKWKLQQEKKDNKQTEEISKKIEIDDRIKNTFLEPVLNNQNPKWLCLKEKEFFPVVPGRSMEEAV